MFDIGFWELVLIGVVALLVIGPERLPAVARTVGIWVGRARRFVSTVQEDISQEINKTEELKRLLQEQSQIKEMHEIIEHTVDETRKTVAVGRKSAQQLLTEDEKLSAHAPHSLEDDAQPVSSHAPKAPATQTSGTTAKPKASASATDPVNDKPE